MSRNGTKAKRRNSCDAISRVAHLSRTDWDPIGNRHLKDLPTDEYESYAPHIVSIILSGTDDSAIADYLTKLETETICVSSGVDLTRLAGKLRIATRTALEAVSRFDT